ncbi:MAG: hypothetical protein [Bacteriophage sp.]|nr:MAG: hypothetical protein [Bacteriophage sp.]
MSNALATIAQSSGVSVEDVTDVLKGMIISAKNQHGSTASNAELAVVSGVCAKYDLNPMVKECAAFISGGKLQVVLMIDGWYRIVNRQPNFDGVEFDDHIDDKGALTAITCKMYIKGRSRPVVVTEYMAECRDGKSSVWQKWPARMLRHKAYIQCARMTFGISDMIDNDEASRITQGERDVTPQRPAAATVDYPAIEEAMSKCETNEALTAMCTDIRVDMEKRGIWNSEKHLVIEMNGRHKKRIADAAVVVDEFIYDVEADMDPKPEEVSFGE